MQSKYNCVHFSTKLFFSTPAKNSLHGNVLKVFTDSPGSFSSRTPVLNLGSNSLCVSVVIVGLLKKFIDVTSNDLSGSQPIIFLMLSDSSPPLITTKVS